MIQFIFRVITFADKTLKKFLMVRLSLVLVFLCAFSARIHCQEKRLGDAAIGVGIDYGGLIGAKATFNALPHLGIFAALGYELVDIGWNVGVLGRILPADGKRSVRPYLKAMYGANGATKVEGKSEYDKVFTGLTLGIGSEFRFGKSKKWGINADFNIPLRSADFYSTLNKIRQDPQIESIKEPPDFSISAGFHFEF
jgi:hypothetical protein